MTFIIGMKCCNGLVLAADSQEGDGYTRRLVNKLEIYQTPTWGICWGVGGSARIADKFSDKLKLSLDEVKNYDRGKIEAWLEACLKTIGKRYMNSRGIEVIAGVFGPHPKNAKLLEWHILKGDSHDACVSIQRGYGCAGTGDNSLANFVLANLDVRYSRVFQANHLAVFMTSLMKEYADGVGGPTRVWNFSNPTAQWLPLATSKVRQFEKEFSVEVFERYFTNFWQDTEGAYFNQWMEEENREYMEGIKLMQSISQKSK